MFISQLANSEQSLSPCCRCAVGRRISIARLRILHHRPEHLAKLERWRGRGYAEVFGKGVGGGATPDTSLTRH